MSTTTTRSWQNWAGSVSATPAAMPAPDSLEAIRAIVRDVAARGGCLRVVGAGHSFTPLVATNDTIMTLDGYAGLVSVDAGSAQAVVKAGTRLYDLGTGLAAHGLAQENLGDINVQSLAGALSTGTHGTGAGLGVVATQARALTLVTGDGEVVRCSESERPELFKAAQVSLGALGVITEVTLQAMPVYKLKATKGPARLDDLLANLETHKRDHRHFEFFWFPHTDRAQVKFLDVTNEPAETPGFGKWANDVVLENGAFWALCEASRVVPAFAKTASRIAGAAISGSTEVNWSHLIFATPRMVRFLEMEYALPAESLSAALEEVRASIAREGFAVNFPLEVRFGRGDDIWLSPAYGRDTAYVAVHMYRGMPHEAYFAALEAIFIRHGGRPHWGKLHTQTAATLRDLYPMWDAFQAQRTELDPQGVFLNDHLRKLFLT
jgi:L-gulonolactone oxidase